LSLSAVSIATAESNSARTAFRATYCILHGCSPSAVAAITMYTGCFVR
jgi:hypothetical protein